MSLAEVRRRVTPGKLYDVTHSQYPELGAVRVVVTRAGGTRFFVRHALGETRVGWPPARHVEADEDGTIRLLGQGGDAGKPFLTLVPVAATTTEGER